MRSISCFALSMAALLGCGEDLEIPRPRTEDHPVLLWHGPRPTPPPCPEGRLDYWDGWADVSANPQEECGTCSCGPAACVLPSGVTAHRSICPGGSDDIPVKITSSNNSPGRCMET